MGFVKVGGDRPSVLGKITGTLLLKIYCEEISYIIESYYFM
jgi:hypothetical protein